MPTISDDEAALIVKALEHYHVYLVAAKREDSTYQNLAERLKRKSRLSAIGKSKVSKPCGAVRSRRRLQAVLRTASNLHELGGRDVSPRVRMR